MEEIFVCCCFYFVTIDSHTQKKKEKKKTIRDTAPHASSKASIYFLRIHFLWMCICSFRIGKWIKVNDNHQISSVILTRFAE